MKYNCMAIEIRNPSCVMGTHSSGDAHKDFTELTYEYTGYLSTLNSSTELSY
jgi:hypothetical protein